MRLGEIEQQLDAKTFSLLKPVVDQLRPSQEKAIHAGILDGKTILVCCPTASGKTLIGEMGCLQSIFQRKKKAIYIVPLRALAREKYRSFVERYGNHVKITLSVGDFDNGGENLGRYEWIVCTSEKLDSVIRHDASWLKDVGVVVIDEIHLIDDVSRGPTVEVLITMLKRIISGVQLIGLSATIGNSKALSDWLEAELVEDDWRPVPLYEGVYCRSQLDFFGKKEPVHIDERDDAVLALSKHTVAMGKQALVFVNSKPSAESTAEKIASGFPVGGTDAHELSQQVLKAIHPATKQCERLSRVLEKGIAFHHSGLVSKQHQLIEEAFRKGIVKIICATPTLAAGIDIPAFRTILKDLRRYSDEGYDWIPVLEYKQQAGRAGRPSFDSYGEAICIASSEDQKNFLYEQYLYGDIESIQSKLGVEPVLRTYLLSLIAGGFIHHDDDILSFFEKTFYAFQFGDINAIKGKIHQMLQMLIDFEFLEEQHGVYKATHLGRRVSQLYLDPLTAHFLLDTLQEIPEGKTITSLGLLHLIASTLEMRPSFRVKAKEMDFIEAQYLEAEHTLLLEMNHREMGEEPLFSFKTGYVLHEWTNEKGEEQFLERYGVRPGELRAKLDVGDWLLYSIVEMAGLIEKKNVAEAASILRERLHHGCKEELLNLIRLKNIGRVRARILFRNGIKHTLDVKRADFGKLVTLLGEGIAKDIKAQVGEPVTQAVVEQQKL